MQTAWLNDWEISVSTSDIHEPVLVREVMQYLQVKKGGWYIDATMNGGGHTNEILKQAGRGGGVLGIERDPELIKKAKQKNGINLIVEESNYTNMEQLAKKHNLTTIDGILFDFGLSSWHLDASGRGFSFRRDEVLDMRFSQKDAETAAEIVNTYSESNLADIFMSYGEVRQARRVAHAITEARKKARILTTSDLVKICKRITPKGTAMVFQALRIAVNKELEAVQLGIAAAMRLVAPGGRIVAISFHSLEDRIVKNAFRTSGIVLTKKPVCASRDEMVKNPRAGSAKLRAWERV